MCRITIKDNVSPQNDWRQIAKQYKSSQDFMKQSKYVRNKSRSQLLETEQTCISEVPNPLCPQDVYQPHPAEMVRMLSEHFHMEILGRLTTEARKKHDDAGTN